MALLDVSEVIRDTFATSPVQLVKRTETMDSLGNPEFTDSEPFDIMAVVTQDSKVIRRLPHAMQREGTISVRFVVADAPEDFFGGGYDRVVWRGKPFVVVDTADYSQFGEGFLRLTCTPEDTSNGNY